MKKRYTITIDPTVQTNKPSGAEVGKISKSLTMVTGLTITDIARIISQPYSYTWSPAVFNSSRSNSTWREQEVFALDFDSGITPEEVINRLKEFDIIPNLIYFTFGDSPERRKFRLVIFIDTIINELEVKQDIQKGLLKLFPEADKSCCDTARMFFGGTISEVLNEEPIPFNKILDFISIVQFSGVHNSNKKIREKRLLLYYIYRNTRNSHSSIIEISGPQAPEYLKNLNKNLFDFEKCKQRVRIFREFLEGKWLYYPELLGLAINLRWVNGGLKLMKETMTKYNNMGLTHYNQNNFNIMLHVKQMNYLPETLSKFSPHPEDHEYLNLITAVKDIRGHIG